jgi:hypothetical protein
MYVYDLVIFHWQDLINYGNTVPVLALSFSPLGNGKSPPNPLAVIRVSVIPSKTNKRKTGSALLPHKDSF